MRIYAILLRLKGVQESLPINRLCGIIVSVWEGQNPRLPGDGFSARAASYCGGMAEYRRGAHTVFDIHLHVVWITKYRRAALKGEVATRVRDLIRDVCAQHEVRILKGHVSKDHVHLFMSIPPQVTISRLLQWLKGKTAHHLLAEFPHLKKQFWGRHLWARGYFCCSSGNVTDEMVAEYIANQNVNEGQDEDFQVDG